MQFGEEQYAPDYLQRVLSEFELDDADVQRQQSVEQMESDERLKPQQLDKQMARRKSAIDSLERESDTLFNKAFSIRDRLEERKEEDDFQENKADNAIDTADWRRVMTLQERYEEIIVKMGLEKEVALVTMDDLEALVDEQKRIHRGKEYLEQAKELVANQREHDEQKLDLLREFMRHQTERMATAVESVSEQQVQVQQLLEIVTELQDRMEQVSDTELAERLDEIQQQLESLEDDLEPAEEDDSSGEPQLSDTERRIISLLEEEPGLSDSELAQKVSVKKTRAAQLREGLVERGLVPPQQEDVATG